MFNFKKISFQLKLADLPSFFPEDIKNHPDIINSTNNIEKDLLDLKNFNKEIHLQNNYEDTFFKSIKFELEKIKEKSDVAKYLLSIDIEKLLIDNRLDLNIKLEDGKLNKDQKITNIYSNLQKKYNLTEIEKLNGFKEYSGSLNRKKSKYYVVFSKDPIDIMTMSSRSDWTSCQNIFSDSIHRSKAVGTALMKNVGIIYLTDNSNFLDRGKKMIYRSLVRIIKSKDTDESLIYLDKMYPNENQKIKSIFKEELQKNTNFKVIEKSDLSKYKNLYIDNKNYNSNLSKSYYDDDLDKFDKSSKSIQYIIDYYYTNHNKIINNKNYAFWVANEIISLFFSKKEISDDLKKELYYIISDIRSYFSEEDSKEIDNIYYRILNSIDFKV